MKSDIYRERAGSEVSLYRDSPGLTRDRGGRPSRRDRHRRRGHAMALGLFIVVLGLAILFMKDRWIVWF